MRRRLFWSLSIGLLWTFGCSGNSSRVLAGSTGGTCPAGSERCACYGNGTCDGDLQCFSHLCVAVGSGGSSNTGASGAGGQSNAGGVATAATSGGTAGSGGTVSTVGGANTGGGGAGNTTASTNGGVLSSGGITAAGASLLGGTASSNGGAQSNGGAPAGGGATVSGGAAAGGSTGLASGGTPATGGSAAMGGTSASSMCGDGKRDDAEACDDGNTVAGDGCSPDCQQENGFTCTDRTGPDVQSCPSALSQQCIVLPMTLRDFDGQQSSSTGHPDFFYRGAQQSTVQRHSACRTQAARPTPIFPKRPVPAALPIRRNCARVSYKARLARTASLNSIRRAPVVRYVHVASRTGTTRACSQVQPG